MKKYAFALAATLALPSIAAAESAEGDKWEISAMAAYVEPDDKRWDSDYGIGLRFGALYHLNQRWGFEIAVHGNALRRESSGDHWQYGANPEVLFFFTKKGWRPYATAGVGLGYIDTTLNDRDISAYWSGGLGLISPTFLGNVRLRADARYHHEFADDGTGREPYGDMRFHLGVMMPIGRTKVEEKVQVITEVREVIVEREVVVEKPPEVKKSEVLRGVNFEISSANLTANARTVLREVADRLKFHSHIRVEIAGHTDSTGSAELNERLSLERAESVKNFLVQEGIEAERLTTAGYGPSQPVASNNTAQGREENRRIEMRRLDK